MQFFKLILLAVVLLVLPASAFASEEPTLPIDLYSINNEYIIAVSAVAEDAYVVCIGEVTEEEQNFPFCYIVALERDSETEELTQHMGKWCQGKWCQVPFF